MSKRQKKLTKEQLEAKEKAMSIYSDRDTVLDYISLNEEAAYKPWEGIFVKREKISTKRFGDTTRWLFRLEKDEVAGYSLLCDSETLHSVMELCRDDEDIPCLVFKSPKGEWRIVPYWELGSSTSILDNT